VGDILDFLGELKRRHVYRVGAAYAVAGWLLVQIVTQVLPIFHVSELAQRLLVLAVVAGFPLALVLAWIYDLTPQGIVRTRAVETATSGAAKDKTAERDHRPALRWSFGTATLDERTLELSIDGQVVALASKPLDLLIALLRQPGDVVTDEELRTTVWPGRVISDTDIGQTAAALRLALDDADESTIQRVQDQGYRLAVPVKIEVMAGTAAPRFDFKPGDAPPLRPNWSLVECLDAGGHGEVWLARNLKTHEERVYKFALKDSSLPSLKREITVSRLLHDSLGPRATPFVRVLEWNLDTRPYFIECEYAAGGSLLRWAQAQGGIDQVPMAVRVDIAIQIAEALAAAHSVDVLHKDLKPANVLVDPLKNGKLRVRLCDFGSGGLLDIERLSALGITQMGFTRVLTQDGQTSGTPLYYPPEILSGQPATRQSDVFSLGVMLYQLVVGDLRRPLALGWELDVGDISLRKTIAAAAAGNPARRLKTADELVERLRNLGSRPGPAVAVDKVSIAVLPFANLGGDPKNDYLGDSISDELIAGFGRVELLQVLPRSAVAAYKDSPLDPVEIGRTLQVHAILAGELQRSADQLQFAVRLVRIDDEELLWSQTCERPFGDLLMIQEEVAQAVLDALHIKKPTCHITRPGTDNVPAYDFFLRGKYHWMTQDRQINQAAIDNLQQAITLDSAFARSHSQLAQACWTRIYFIDPDDHGALKRGFAAAERALTLDPNLAEAHMARGHLAWTPSAKFAYSTAIKEYKRALAINGRLSAVWGQLAGVYLHAGMFDEALSVAHKGHEADPGDLSCNFQIAQMPIWMGQYEEGLDKLERLPRAFNPTLWYYATVTALLALERNFEAEARLDEFFQHHPDKGGLMTSMRARMLATAGHDEEAEKAIAIADSADRRFGHFHHTAYEIAGAYAQMKRKPEAFKYLHETVHTGYPCCSLIDRDPVIASLRGDPEYQKIMEWPRQQCQHFKTL
jgi:TolB-like protein/DNA-binding winged helix-turn-helix (wHTH) protein